MPFRKILILCALGAAYAAVAAVPLPAPTPVTPSSGSVNVDPNSVCFQWSKVPRATAYEWRLLLNGNVLMSATLDADHNWRDVKNLDYGTTYGWRVRAFQGANAGQWMPTIPLFKTLATPTATKLLSPLNNSTSRGSVAGQKIKVRFAWQAIPGNGQYLLCVSQSPNGPFEQSTNVGTSGEKLLDWGKTYYWYVKGYSVATSYPKSQVWSFTTYPSELANWSLVWHDEFNEPDGSAPNPANWGYDTGYWVNHEMEYYTDSPNNVRIKDGNLVIQARQEVLNGTNGYTSARLKTEDKQSWTYGRFEARIKIPRGQGMWPAFWMLGANIETVNWPACGEIDIMENIGREPNIVHGTIHGPGYSGETGVGWYDTLPDASALADKFHVYAIEWEANSISWFVDGLKYRTITRSDLQGKQWVFDLPQFLLLNVAVGGGWTGQPTTETIFPQSMLVDYVRVYKNTAQ